jgi:hypothetical protein
VASASMPLTPTTTTARPSFAFSASLRASRLGHSVGMHRTSSSGIILTVVVVRQGKTVGKEQIYVRT